MPQLCLEFSLSGVFSTHASDIGKYLVSGYLFAFGKKLRMNEGVDGVDYILGRRCDRVDREVYQDNKKGGVFRTS